jgi:hypothetical protein
VKKGAVMLAAVETVADADPVWASRRHNSNVATQATAGESVHAAPPLKQAGRMFTTNSTVIAITAAPIAAIPAIDPDKSLLGEPDAAPAQSAKRRQ